MAPSQVVEAFKAPLKRKRVGGKPFETEVRERLTRLETVVWLLVVVVLGGKIPPGLFGN